MQLLRSVLKPTLKPGQVDRYRPTLENLSKHIEDHQGQIARLIIYPLKSIGGFDVDKADLTPTGLGTHSGFHDRAAMIVRETKHGLERFSQRQEPLLAQIKTRLLSEELLELQNASGDSVQLSSSAFCYRGGETTTAEMYKDILITGVLEDNSGPITRFIRNHLASLDTYTTEELKNIRILHGSNKVQRDVPITHSGGIPSHTNFADVGQHLLINRATVRDYLDRHIHPNVSEEAYRPNIVIEGWPENLEDLIAFMKIIRKDIEDLYLYCGVPSTRCAVTMVDQETGTKRRDGEPLKSLMHLRPLHDGQPTMGINVSHAWGAQYREIHVGDLIVPVAEKMIDEENT